MIQPAQQDAQPTAEPGTEVFDVVLIGAGVHGASMACEAVSRGLKTLLIQGGKVGGTASCVPSDIVGAGLNQLENLQLSELMVNRDELARLHAKAPHLTHPITAYALPHPDVRSDRKAQIGLKLYRRLSHGQPYDGVDASFRQCFPVEAFYPTAAIEYRVNYARIAIALLQQFTQKGGQLLLANVDGAQRGQERWRLNAQASDGNARYTVAAKTLINCTGCHSSVVLKDVLGVRARSMAGSLHSAQLYFRLPQEWRHAVIFQRRNKSLVYAHGFGDQHVCLGPVLANDESDKAKAQAIDEVLALWNHYAQIPLTREHLAHACWSAHPIVDDPSSDKLDATNTTLLDLHNPGDGAPLLTLFGNNLVQYRRIATQALDILQPFTHKKRNADYAGEALPGGEFAGESMEAVLAQWREHYPFLDANVLLRLLNTYGTNTLHILGNAHSETELGRAFGAGLYACEVDYVWEHEWARTAEDILWRRTTLGLVFTPEQESELTQYLKSKMA